jgi:hypothetical protein
MTLCIERVCHPANKYKDDVSFLKTPPLHLPTPSIETSHWPYYWNRHLHCRYDSVAVKDDDSGHRKSDGPTRTGSLRSVSTLALYHGISFLSLCRFFICDKEIIICLENIKKENLRLCSVFWGVFCYLNPCNANEMPNTLYVHQLQHFHTMFSVNKWGQVMYTLSAPHSSQMK